MSIGCQHCGNDEAVDGYRVCMDCLEELGDDPLTSPLPQLVVALPSEESPG